MIAINYLKTSFITDFFALLPYYIIRKELIFLRYLKVFKFRLYRGYFDDFFIETMEHSMERQTMKKIIDIEDVIKMLAFASHITACIWMYIGYQQLQINQGWIYENNAGGI